MTPHSSTGQNTIIDGSTKPWPEGAVDDWREGASYGWIAEKYGRAYDTVSKLMKRHQHLGTERIADPTKRRGGVNGGTKRLTDQLPISQMHQAVGIKLNVYREMKNSLNYDQMGTILGTNRRTARKMELGIHDFTLGELTKMSGILDMKLEDLLKPASVGK